MRGLWRAGEDLRERSLLVKRVCDRWSKLEKDSGARAISASGEGKSARAVLRITTGQLTKPLFSYRAAAIAMWKAYFLLDDFGRLRSAMAACSRRRAEETSSIC